MRIERRAVGRLAAAAVAGAGLAACSPDSRGGRQPRSTGVTTPIGGTSRRQSGVDLPTPRQQYADIRVVDLDRPGAAREVLGDLGVAVERVVRTRSDAGASALTVTVGVAPWIVKDAGFTGPGTVDLPQFARERMDDNDRGGDVMVQVCADDRGVVDDVVRDLRRSVASLRPRWSVAGFRGDVVAPFDDVGRNLLGFHDGTTIPRTAERLDDDVWTGADDPIADATVCVVRRMPLDVERFTALTTPQQERAIGRRKGSGKPLSGGAPQDDVDLRAKSDAGVYDVPLDAHVRRAHPFVGGAGRLMLRRSYSYDEGPGDRGQLFICFQRDVDVFVATQRALDEADALMEFTRTTAGGTWLVLPWEPGTRLGDALWA